VTRRHIEKRQLILGRATRGGKSKEISGELNQGIFLRQTEGLARKGRTGRVKSREKVLVSSRMRKLLQATRGKQEQVNPKEEGADNKKGEPRDIERARYIAGKPKWGGGIGMKK